MSQFQVWHLGDPVGQASDVDAAIALLAQEVLDIISNLYDPADAATQWVSDQTAQISKALADAALHLTAMAQAQLQAVMDVVNLHLSAMTAEAQSGLSTVQQSLALQGVDAGPIPSPTPEQLPPAAEPPVPDPTQILAPPAPVAPAGELAPDGSPCVTADGIPRFNLYLIPPGFVGDQCRRMAQPCNLPDPGEGFVYAGTYDTADAAITAVVDEFKLCGIPPAAPPPPPPPDAPPPIYAPPVPQPIPNPQCPAPEPAAPPLPCGPCGVDVDDGTYAALYSCLMSALANVSSAITARLALAGQTAQTDSLTESQAAQTVFQCAALILGTSCGGGGGGQQDVDIDQPHVLRMDERAEKWHDQLKTYYGQPMVNFLELDNLGAFISARPHS